MRTTASKRRYRRKRRLIILYGPRCYICKQIFPEDILTFDHVIPLSKGGSDRFVNIMLACKPCNNSKSDTLPPNYKEWLTRNNVLAEPRKSNLFGTSICRMCENCPPPYEECNRCGAKGVRTRQGARLYI